MKLFDPTLLASLFNQFEISVTTKAKHENIPPTWRPMLSQSALLRLQYLHRQRLLFIKIRTTKNDKTFAFC